MMKSGLFLDILEILLYIAVAHLAGFPPVDHAPQRWRQPRRRAAGTAILWGPDQSVGAVFLDRPSGVM